MPRRLLHIAALFLFVLPIAAVRSPAPAVLAAERGGDPREEFFRRNAAEELPGESRHVRFVKIRSELLSRFHGRPVYLLGGVLLPRAYDREPGRRYPLWVRIGGFGSRYRYVRESVGDDGPAAEPAVLTLWLDGFGPYGNPSQVNSENNGPYGDAVIRELIPHVERQFRGMGRGSARFVSGTSTGGWAALALQTFYPDSFNGAYAFWPDPVDFRAFETINIYKDANAYADAEGKDRAAVRNRRGRTTRTVRQECREEANGAPDRQWTLSRGQWGAWNAIYSPRGPDGHPAPLWDGRTGRINRAVARRWQRYDLRLVLERNWRTLGPKLRDRLHVWVGERDPYFLNEAVHHLNDFLSRAAPLFEGRIIFNPDGGHGGFRTIGEQQMMREMVAASRDGANEAVR